MGFTKAEEDVLVGLRHIQMEKPADEKAIKEYQNQPWRDVQDWTEAMTTLLDKGLITKTRAPVVYSLTEPGNQYAAQMYHERMNAHFNTSYQRCSESKAYSMLCERVYGIDLCQFNNIAKTQLQFLIDLLDLDESNCVLDMGCGLGKMSEYIAEVTGAAVTGLDIAEGAIKLAKERTKGKDGLTFVIKDFNELDFDENSFDAVICIEAFFTGLDTTVKQLKEIINPGGQMGIHLRHQIAPNDPKERLLPENTDLSIVLKKYDLSYRTWDFTPHTLDLYRNWIKVSKELQPEFEAENNVALCSIEAHEKMLRLWETDVMRQYLYHVIVP